MYTTVFLDADMTIWDFEASERLALRDVITSLGEEMTEELMAFYHQVNGELWHAFELKQVTREELSEIRFRKLLDYMGRDGDPLALNTQYQEGLGTYSIMLPGAEDLCRQLAQHCTLYILTNGMHAAQFGRFHQSPIKPYIKQMFVSADMGTQKPDKAYYDQVFRAIGLEEKSTAVMVGDSLTSDVLGGINAGIDTIWYNPQGKPVNPNIQPTYVANSMDKIAELILS